MGFPWAGVKKAYISKSVVNSNYDKLFHKTGLLI